MIPAYDEVIDRERLGKTFSAEATTELLKRPLYVVGAASLGTDARTLDQALEHIFEVAAIWNAIVLIDEVSGQFLLVFSFVISLSGGCIP